MRGTTIVAVVLLTCLLQPWKSVHAADPPLNYTRVVRPILSDACFRCHGSDEGARKAKLRLDTPGGAYAQRKHGGFAIVPGDPDASMVIVRLTTSDPEDRMPPEGAHPIPSSEEINIIRRWIEQGADYPAHWSFSPPEDPPIPATHREAWCRNGIDNFILDTLEAEGLAPSPEADRETIIRRLSLDLLGLPPTVEDMLAFVGDERPDAYDRLVDRLLASEHFGERWARVWLDLARYADSRGYEKDTNRTLWPYRDWVIDAYNEDMPFDEFTIEQLAGDLLPSASPRQRLATAFHRNTMNNTEGGTDNEEFRVAAVVDRVNTTAQVWMGLSMGCAQCHSHKYDPISQVEYYRFFDFFNQTADADRDDDYPTMPVYSREDLGFLENAQTQHAALVADRLDTVTEVAYTDPWADADGNPLSRGEGPHEVILIDDALPPGGAVMGGEPFVWDEEPPQAPISGHRVWKVTGKPDSAMQSFYHQAALLAPIQEGDRVFAHVYLDPETMPREIMLQFHDTTGSWEHRAYWGENLIRNADDGTPALRGQGSLPPAGTWTRLDVSAKSLGLEPGIVLDGIAFTIWGGETWWDAAGIIGSDPPDVRAVTSLAVWEDTARKGAWQGVSTEVQRVLHGEVALNGAVGTTLLRKYFISEVLEPEPPLLAGISTKINEVEQEIHIIESRRVAIPVMQALTAEHARQTKILARGSFLDPQDVVTAGTPEVFHAMHEDEPRDRLGLARWLVDPRNPLTARVQVNRTWSRIFGTGIVETEEDFGTQGMEPSHPELLDWLAHRFMESGWSHKELCRVIVSSAVYRQTATLTHEILERDPRNRLLARSPRFRLEAEMIRDQALVIGGLLNPVLHGPPVYPPQPEGVWQIPYDGRPWKDATDQDRFRRGLYTFWRRTAPYPSMVTFDAPSREFCVSRRIRTNTPLQALVLLNDPVYLEAAGGLAGRMLKHQGESDSARLAFGFRIATSRLPGSGEMDSLLDLLASERLHYQADPAAAEALARFLQEIEVDATESAAWFIVSSVILNLDELLVRG